MNHSQLSHLEDSNKRFGQNVFALISDIFNFRFSHTLPESTFLDIVLTIHTFSETFFVKSIEWEFVDSDKQGSVQAAIVSSVSQYSFNKKLFG